MSRIRSWPKIFSISLSVSLSLSLHSGLSLAASPAAPAPAKTDIKKQAADRMVLFQEVGAATGLPWYLIAAIDQYERTLHAARKLPARGGLTGIYIPESEWAGLLNPNPADTDPKSIAVYRGMGKDGSGDGIADRNNDMDLLAALLSVIAKHGLRMEEMRIGMWDYYQNSRSVQRIQQFAKIYEAGGTLDLNEHAFPLPIRSNYSYRSTWGASRGWGGFRIHEGTDLFADFGVPVRSTCYGIIEIKGWNPYGGWRLGIRDLNNMYHYYAHLSGYTKNLKEGDLVKPGQTIGWVGSSGYGKPGTSGKFPPHLHYGLYRDNGLNEWSFDPYPSLRRWEKEERQRGRSK